MSTTLTELMNAHTEALAAYDADHDTHDKENDVTGLAVDAARDALLAHRPTTLDEVATKAAYMAAHRTFTEWDNFDQVQLILALTPAAADPTRLSSLIAAFHAAKADYDLEFKQTGECDGPAYDTYDAAEDEVLRHPCASLDEVCMKVRFILDSAGPYDTVRNCQAAGEETLRPFMRSLLGEAS